MTLTSRINAVRKAVGDSGEEQRLIRTIARKGFRFVGEVLQAQTPREATALARQPPRPDNGKRFISARRPMAFSIAYAAVGSGPPLVKTGQLAHSS